MMMISMTGNVTAVGLVVVVLVGMMTLMVVVVVVGMYMAMAMMAVCRVTWSCSYPPLPRILPSLHPYLDL